MAKNNRNGMMKDYQLAVLSRAVFDIGPRTRALVLLFGLVGIGLAFMESLVSGQAVPLDKIIHFSGYFILSATFVLALRPLLFVPGLLGLVAMGVAIEFLQRHTGRSFDWMDAYANTLGVAAGGLTGMTIRGIYALVRKEMAARNAARRRYTFRQGETLIREDDPIEDLYIIQSGRVRATRRARGREVPLGHLGAGEVLGIIGVVEGTPQYATLTAVEPTTVYRMNLHELMESAGGSGLPVSLVLSGLCGKLRVLADQAAKSGRGLPADRTLL
jgi:hypothetical protein